MLILLYVGVEDLRVGDVGLFGGVDGLLEGVPGRITGGGLERVAEDGLDITCPKLLLDREDGLRRHGLALPLLLLHVFSFCSHK